MGCEAKSTIIIFPFWKIMSSLKLLMIKNSLHKEQGNPSVSSSYPSEYVTCPGDMCPHPGLPPASTGGVLGFQGRALRTGRMEHRKTPRKGSVHSWSACPEHTFFSTRLGVLSTSVKHGNFLSARWEDSVESGCMGGQLSNCRTLKLGAVQPKELAGVLGNG